MMSDKELDKLDNDMENLGLYLEPRDTIYGFVGRLHKEGTHIIDIYTSRFYVLDNGYGVTSDVVKVIERLQRKKLTNHLVG
jgi:hypothetical protein